MKHMTMRFILLLTLLGWIAVGCSVGDITTAGPTADEFLRAIKTKDYDKAFEMCDSRCFEKMSQEEWKGTLERLNEKLGVMKNFSLLSANVQANFGTTFEGTVFIFRYKVENSNYPSTETITLIKSQSGSSFKVISYDVNSSGLVKHQHANQATAFVSRRS